MFDKELQKYNLMSYRNEETSILKDVLLDKLNFSVRSLSRMKREKSILVNGEFEKLNTKLKSGDLIEVKINEDKANFEPQDLKLNILFDDFDIIMVDKPPFMVVHPTKSHVDNTIANGVTHFIDEKDENVKIRFVNRLDMNTSGLVIVAKNAYAHHVLSDDMKYDKVEKKYITIVKGVVKDDKGVIDVPIYRSNDDTIKRLVDDRGQHAVTHYKVLERLKDATVLEVELFTGRTHQIRVHMEYIGHGIIGDELYGYVDESLITRQALHAYSLKFEQPRTREVLEFESNIPKDMKDLIDKLK
ncbi:RluA family pseudouridine synthase [Metaclostridioides mangenotii]|uniref:RluA family pseudouridine synthase n=1 Tax=Metaclostridioides mangenotii TaxID=1540 RepID=UPI0028E3CFCB|nr:RluA family pseudouridine synthase [Clostridioides mangenotii]